MNTDLTSQFVFPNDALLDFADRGAPKIRTQKDGVAQYEVGEFDKGIAYEFFNHYSKNEMQSEQFDMEINDTIQMVRWIVTPRKLEPVCRVTDLPPQLLKFRKVFSHKNSDGVNVMKFYKDEKTGEMEAVSGVYKDAYIRWLKGMSAPGTPLSKWDKIAPSEVKTLASQGIFSLEQWASIPENQVHERYPKMFHDLHKAAVHAVNAQNAPVSINEIKKYADQVQEEKQNNAKLAAVIESLTERLTALEALELAEKRVASKPKKKVTKVKPDEAQPTA